ncbi:MAG: archaellin/type IV pilin N-terminal domain-containing protein [Candidatus Woesearchaeota archaeon]
MIVFSNRRGMSPLIATVLLIAFAVALGAMIMNWSAGIDDDAHGEDGHDSASVCGEVALSADGSACYGDNKIRFDAKNTGSHRIDGIKLSISTSSTEYEIKVKDSALIEEETATKSVPYAHAGGEAEVEFIPMVEDEDELHECGGSGFVKALSEC